MRESTSSVIGRQLRPTQADLGHRGFFGGFLENGRIDPGEFGFNFGEKSLYRMGLEFVKLAVWLLAKSSFAVFLITGSTRRLIVIKRSSVRTRLSARSHTVEVISGGLFAPVSLGR